MPRIFVSYSRRDASDLAKRIVGELRSRGYDVFFDQSDILGGDPWALRVQEELGKTDVVLALVSHESYRSRICQAEHSIAVDERKPVIPLIVQAGAPRPLILYAAQYLDFSAPAEYPQQFAALMAAIERPSVPLQPPRNRICLVPPPLPRAFQPRPAEREQVLQKILAGSQPITAITGIPGVGKSVLALSLCKDRILAAAFPDGVIWLDFQKAGGLAHIQTLLETFLGTPPRLDAPGRAEMAVCRLLAERAILIVLNDVYDIAQVTPFLTGDSRSSILLTTQNAHIAYSLGAAIVHLNPLGREHSLNLLRQATAPVGLTIHDSELEAIAEQAQDLPITLQVAASFLLQGVTPRDWIAVQPGADVLDNPDPTQHLSGPDRNLFYSLAVFPRSTYVAVRIIEKYWLELQPSLNPATCHVAMTRLKGYSLLEEAPDRTHYVLHSFLRDHSRRKLSPDELRDHQRHFLDAHRPADGHWSSLVEDRDYFLAHLAHHLAEAALSDEIASTLLDFEWVSAKLRAYGVNDLLEDFSRAPLRPALTMVQRAIRLSHDTLSRNPDQLASALIGRLRSTREPGVREMLLARRARSGPWLEPLRRTLNSPSGPLRRVLRGHSSGVTALAVSSDGTLFASGSDDRTLRVWKLATGENFVLEGHDAGIKSVAFLPDGRIVSGSDDHTVRIWFPEKGAKPDLVGEHTGPVTALAVWGPSGLILSADDDGALSGWDPSSPGTPTFSARANSPLRAIAVLQDSGIAFTGSEAGEVALYSLPAGSRFDRWDAHALAVWAVAELDGDILTGSWDGSIVRWDPNSRKSSERKRAEYLGHANGVTSLAAAAGCNWFASGSADDTARIWDLKTPVDGSNRCFVGHASWVRAVAVTPGGEILLSGSDDGTIAVWETTLEVEPEEDYRHADAVRSVALQSGCNFALSASANGEMQLWPSNEGDRPDRLPSCHRNVSCVAFAGAGRSALLGRENGDISILDLENGGSETGLLPGDGAPIRVIAVSPDGGWVASIDAAHTVSVWKIEQRRFARRFTPPRRVTGLCLGECGRVLGLATSEHVIEIHELLGGTSFRLEPAGAEITAMALVDGSMVIAGVANGEICAWDLSSRRLVSSRTAHRSAITQIAVSPQFSYVGSCSNDGDFKLWPGSSFSQHGGAVMPPAATFTGNGPMYCCAIGDDSRTIVVGEAGGHVHILHFHAGQTASAFLR
jgi:WD40 repeat protein